MLANVEHAKNIKLIYLPFLCGIFLIIFLFQHKIFIITSLRCVILCIVCMDLCMYAGALFFTLRLFVFTLGFDLLICFTVIASVASLFHSNKLIVWYQYFLCIQVLKCLASMCCSQCSCIMHHSLLIYVYRASFISIAQQMICRG